jgi:acyl-CoA reductase-like NAD-dependent aldehyde dehydrogenase
MTTSELFAPTTAWSGKIYSNGWKRPGLGTAEVTEKATGAKLGEIGVASPEDVSAAAATARAAQKEWASLPGPKRGDLLREVSRLLLAYGDEIANQLIRETGSIRAKAQWEVQISAREFLEAAALGSQPAGVRQRLRAQHADQRRPIQRVAMDQYAVKDPRLPVLIQAGAEAALCASPPVIGPFSRIRR